MKALLQQALDALNGADNIDTDMAAAIEALRTAIAAPEPEPVGHLYTIAGIQHCTIERVLPDGPLYTTPPDTEALRKELEQIKEDQRLLHRAWFGHRDTGHLSFTDAVEQTMKELHAELERVKGEREAMRLSLMEVKACLVIANEQKDGPISDTIWYSDYETLFDYIDNQIEAQAIAAQGEGA